MSAACAEIAAERALRHGSTSTRLEALDPGSPPELDAERHYLEGDPRPDVATLPPRARRDQLRLGLVPDAAQAPRGGRHGGLRLLHRRVGPRDPLPRARGERTRSCARCAPRRSPTSLGQPRDHELMALFAQALRQPRLLPGDAGARVIAAAERLRRPPRRAARRRDVDVLRPRLLQARADHRQRPRARGRRSFRRIDRLSIFADNLSPTSCASTASSSTTSALAAHIDAGRLLRPGPGSARSARARCTPARSSPSAPA